MRKSQGLLDVVIMQMAAILLWLGSNVRWRIIVLASLLISFCLLDFYLVSLKKSMVFKWRINMWPEFVALPRITVVWYFRGCSTYLAELVLAWRASTAVCSPYRQTMFQHYLIPYSVEWTKNKVQCRQTTVFRWAICLRMYLECYILNILE